jgi:nitrogen PTS system EIIA component
VTKRAGTGGHQPPRLREKARPRGRSAAAALRSVRFRHSPLNPDSNFRRSNSCPSLRPSLSARMGHFPQHAIRPASANADRHPLGDAADRSAAVLALVTIPTRPAITSSQQLRRRHPPGRAERISTEILKREELGSTGTDGGVAIPHARIQGLNRSFGILARLNKPIDFEAIDGRPVDLVFLLLLPANPAENQLKALASVARKLRDAACLRDLRAASGSAGL